MAGLTLAQLAGFWSKDPMFINFLNRHVDAAGDDMSARYGLDKKDLDPADYIRSRCKIASRRELNTNEIAARIFDREIRRPFMDWANTQKVAA